MQHWLCILFYLWERNWNWASILPIIQFMQISDCLRASHDQHYATRWELCRMCTITSDLSIDWNSDILSAEETTHSHNCWCFLIARNARIWDDLPRYKYHIENRNQMYCLIMQLWPTFLISWTRAESNWWWWVSKSANVLQIHEKFLWMFILHYMYIHPSLMLGLSGMSDCLTGVTRKSLGCQSSKWPLWRINSNMPRKRMEAKFLLVLSSYVWHPLKAVCA